MSAAGAKGPVSGCLGRPLALSGYLRSNSHLKLIFLVLAALPWAAAQVIGKTDDLGLNIVEDKVEVHDLQATIMHCLGFDHTRLTYRHMGRDFRLTDVHGLVARKMLA